MELLLHQWGDWPELYRNTDKTEATEIVIIYSQMNYRGKLDTYTGLLPYPTCLILCDILETESPATTLQAITAFAECLLALLEFIPRSKCPLKRERNAFLSRFRMITTILKGALTLLKLSDVS